MRSFVADTVISIVVSTALLAACASDDQTTTLPPPPSVTFATQATAAADPTAATDDPSAATTTPSDPTATAPSATTPPATLGDPVIATQVLATFDGPIDVAWRAGDPTAFVAERDGRIVPWRDGVVGEPVLDIIDLTTRDGDEQGLLGLTFSADGTLGYINYTDNDGDTVVAEYAIADGGTFDVDSRRVLITIDQPYGNHNGGNVTIGPDEMLYIGMGDGGDGGDPERYSLNVASLLGKILRIDPTPSGDIPYTVPADNPFIGVAGARGEIWSVGVRNPWRMSFDSVTGDLWFGDVGQNVLEEVDVAWADEGGGRGLNFGWSAYEGTQLYNADQSTDGVTFPIYEYAHGDDTGCSITGGAVYRGSTIPALVGWYVFADYCVGNLYAIRVQDKVLTDSLLLGQQSSVTAIREGPDGELYALTLGGEMTRIVAG